MFISLKYVSPCGPELSTEDYLRLVREDGDETDICYIPSDSEVGWVPSEVESDHTSEEDDQLIRHGGDIGLTAKRNSGWQRC